ncbi:UNVERIFIED_CONTAM: hypothetical protein FKN15_034328, partial [Acipenser sinensis]
LFQKLIIDEKKYYLFGRNPDICDFTIDHQSCSRVHAALVYHKHLKRVFLIDLNSKFNTAHNKRISTLTIEEGNLDIQRPKRKRRSSRVIFSDEEEIINPEDVDPSVGRFRNMIQTAVVPIKKKKLEGHGTLGLEEAVARRMQNFPFSTGLYGDLPPTSHEAGGHSHGAHGGATILGGLPMPFPNLAPDVDLTPASVPPTVALNPTPTPGAGFPSESLNEPKKKKYAKEAWPGKKPTPSLLI